MSGTAAGHVQRPADLSAADGCRCMANEIVSFGQWSLWTSLSREARGLVLASSESFVLTCPSDCVSGRRWSGVFCEAVTCRVGSEMSVLLEYVFS